MCCIVDLYDSQDTFDEDLDNDIENAIDVFFEEHSSEIKKITERNVGRRKSIKISNRRDLRKVKRLKKVPLKGRVMRKRKA